LATNPLSVPIFMARALLSATLSGLRQSKSN
jgi:hypothetical protein